MLKILRLTVALIFTLVVLIVATYLVAGSQPSGNPLAQVLFSNADGSACDKPCAFGISPGKPQQSQDKNRLAQYSWLKDVSLSNGALSGWFDVAGQNDSFFASDDDVWWGSALNADFVPQSVALPKLTLGDVLAKYGSPSFANWKDGYLNLWFGDQKIFVYASTTFSEDAGRVLPTTPVDGISIYASGDLGEAQFQNVPWRGFIDLGNYHIDH